MSNPSDSLREKLIDKLDDQRFGDNVVNTKLLYKDIKWIVDELLPLIKAHSLQERIDSLTQLMHDNQYIPDQAISREYVVSNYAIKQAIKQLEATKEAL